MTALGAAVVGLGQAGSRFDEEPRPCVWSHAGAFLALSDRYLLVGGADMDAGNRERFSARCPNARVFCDGIEMMRQLQPDVVSVCTPPEGRAALVERMLARHRPKALICEKPLEKNETERRRLVAACAEAGVPLLVNYNRRYAQAYRKVRAAIVDGRLGKVISIAVLAPNRLWSVGSHAADLLLYLSGELPERSTSVALPALYEGGEPAGDLICRFPSGAAGRIATVGRRDMSIFEVDVIGDLGRACVTGNGALATIRFFSDSPQYVGYRELGEERELHRTEPGESTFVALALEAADVAEGLALPGSTGQQALAGEELLDALVAQCLRESPL